MLKELCGQFQQVAHHALGVLYLCMYDIPTCWSGKYVLKELCGQFQQVALLALGALYLCITPIAITVTGYNTPTLWSVGYVLKELCITHPSGGLAGTC